MHSCFFCELQLITVLLSICDSYMSWSARSISLKGWVGFFIFDSFSFLLKFIFVLNKKHIQKQPSGGVLRKRCSKNMQQVYRRAPMPKCDFNKAALQIPWKTKLLKCHPPFCSQTSDLSLKVWKFNNIQNNICVNWSILKTDLYVNFLNL